MVWAFQSQMVGSNTYNTLIGVFGDERTISLPNNLSSYTNPRSTYTAKERDALNIIRNLYIEYGK